MSDLIKILSAEKYIAPLQSTQDGKMAFTHLANVKWLDNKPLRFYVKVYPKDKPRGLINEITGYLLAYALGIPQPQKVGMIQLPKEVIAKEHHSKFDVIDDCIIGWLSEESGITPNTYLSIRDLSEFEKTLHKLELWPHLPNLIAFDDWVANQDRNTGNITIQGTSEFKIIDHGNVPVSESWTKNCLVSEKNYRNVLMELFSLDGFRLPESVAIANASKAHLPAFIEVRDELDRWWKIFLEPDCHKKIHEFMAQRAEYSLERIKKRTGLLVA